MSRATRQGIIRKLQSLRDDRLVIAYITSTRTGHEIQIADDVLRLIYEHLEAGRELAKKGVDLFIHSNGGSGTVPWRLVSLIREYTKDFHVLVPHSAFSAATLIALGADKIVMHKMGCLGPIDPSVANIFNPPHPQAPAQLAPISVEDVTAYFKMVKEEIGITHEDELIQALIGLTDKIHPLALGNVQRHHNQSRMMARKLLKQHMITEEEEHEIGQIIDNLKSNLFFHAHPINRNEALKDLKLKVIAPNEEIESLMWNLYIEYENEMKLNEPFNPIHEIDLKDTPTAPAALTTKDIVQQIVQLAQNGVALPQVSEEQIVKLAVAMIPFVSGGKPKANNKIKINDISGVYIESINRTDVFRTNLALERATINTSAGPQDGVKQEVLWQRWESEI